MKDGLRRVSFESDVDGGVDCLEEVDVGAFEIGGDVFGEVVGLGGESGFGLGEAG